MILLEREEPLLLLEGALSRAREGSGHCVFIGGEAGIGKTSLLESFARSLDGDVRILWGACEALATPRPLGPFYDIAHALGGKLLAALDANYPPYRLFQTFVDELRSDGCVTVILIEDAHWADDASADFLKFVARRIARRPALLVVSCREEEVFAGHPLMRAITEVPANHLTRIQLKGLSASGMERLATAHTRKIPNLHALTNGNPFLASELLRGHESDLSDSLRDSMRSRLQQLSRGARELAELVSIIPDRAELELIERAAPAGSAFLQECVDGRTLVIDRDHVRYRHELARRVVEVSLPDIRRRALHARVLEVLAQQTSNAKSLSRLVHHADAAGDAASVLRYAPLAAEEATRRGAHRQGAAFYRAALRYARDVSPRERAALLEKLASESELSGQGDEALDANARAFEIWREDDDTLRQGINRRTRFGLLQFSVFRRGEADFAALPETAKRLLEPHGVSGELAKAHMDMAYVLTMNGRFDDAQAWHDRAIATAEAAEDDAALSYVLLQGELRKHAFFSEPNQAPAERALGLALEHGDDRRTAHAYYWGSAFALNCRRITIAQSFIADGLRFVDERDLDGWKPPLLAQRARAEFAQGNWDAAKATAAELLSRADLPGISEYNSCLVQGSVLARRGDPSGVMYLERALDLATNKVITRNTKILALVRIAEWYWFEHNLALALAFAQRAADEATLMRGHPWFTGKAAFWLWRIGGVVSIADTLAPPYTMQLGGDWGGAATAWESLGCPYERAMALIDGDATAQREAFAVLTRLGANATIQRCRELLVERGVTHIPRGPRPSTRANPMGLTGREIEVLALVEQGLQNVDIGKRLHRSGKTVAHHVSAILAKLGASTRHEAVHIARIKGLLGPTQ